MIEITHISYINGERQLLNYKFRKKQFASRDEMETYRRSLEKRIGKQLFLSYRERMHDVRKTMK